MNEKQELKKAIHALEQGLDELKTERIKHIEALDSQHRINVLNAFIVGVGAICFFAKVIFDKEYIFTEPFIGGAVGFAMTIVVRDLVKNHLDRKFENKQYKALREQGLSLIKAIKEKAKEIKNESAG